jgi:predicted alpha/beta hydrolase
MMERPFKVRCEDGVELQGELFLPENPKGTVQINAGTATNIKFYKPLAKYLASRGFVSCLWDYRGNGKSAPKSLRGCEYRYADYGKYDMSAIKQFLENEFPDLPLMVLGHSAGGQQVGLMPNAKGYAGMLAVAVSTGYAPGMPLYFKLQSHLFFKIITPISIALKGYLRAKPLGIIRFMGKTVEDHYTRKMPFPIHVHSSTDDEISTDQNIDSFWSHIDSPYSITFQQWKPEDIGQKRIKHFGYFRSLAKADIWPRWVEQLDSFVEDWKKAGVQKLSAVSTIP